MCVRLSKIGLDISTPRRPPWVFLFAFFMLERRENSEAGTVMRSFVV